MADDMEFGNDILTLVDEDGQEHEFEIVDTLDLDDESYMALVPVVEGEELLEDSGELVVLKVVTSEGEEFLEPIEDEEEFDKVAAIFMERMGDLYDFEEPEGEDGQ